MMTRPAEADAIEPHDRGLAYDMMTIARRRIDRRRALGLFASAGTVALVGGCGGDGTSDNSVTVTPTPTPTPTPASGTCTTYATETNGPYPADGTNTSSGSTSNVLTLSGAIRSDTRSSFLSTTTTAPGVLVTMTITVVDANNACAPLSGQAVYVWHCDQAGDYSLYDVPSESWLRGIQVTDANGQVTFTTIFPGCYSGRYPHIHFELFSSLSNATSGRYARLISQFALPAAACSTVYSGATGYTTSARNYASTSIAGDNVFGDNSSAQISAMTLTMAGSVAAGYTATATVGVAT